MTSALIKRIPAGFVCAFLMSFLVSVRVVVPIDSAGSCENLASLTLPGNTTTVAQAVRAGGFTEPGTDAGRQNAARNLPEFCRVAATLTPLPSASWKVKRKAVLAQALGTSSVPNPTPVTRSEG